MRLPTHTAIEDLLDGLNVNLWTFDHRTKRANWSRGVQVLLGLATDEDDIDLVRLLELIHPDDAAIATEALAQLCAGEPGFTAELRLRAAEGRWVWVLSRARVCERDPAGHAVLTLGTFVDVGKRKEAELDALRRGAELEALQAEMVVRDRYQRALLDNVPHMVWLKDDQSRLLAANLAYAHVAGAATTEELVGRTDLDYWRPELADRYRADDREVLASGRPKSVEERIEAQGHPRWIETYKSPVIVGGDVIGTVGFARDITDQRRERERLEQSEAALRTALAGSVQMEAQLERERSFLKSVLQGLPDPVWLKSPDGVYLACNSRFEELYGAPESAIVGRTDGDFVSPELAAFFRANDLAAIEAGAARRNEERLTFATGYVGDFETTKTPMFDRDGVLLGVLGIAHDISAARHAEEELRQTEFRWKAALEGSGLGVWDWSPVDGKAYYSPVWWRMIGYDPDNLPEPAPRWIDLVHPDDRDPTVQRLSGYLCGETKDYRAEYRLRCADGSWRWVASGGVVAARTADGLPTRLVGVHFDIHERKESAAALTQAQALARLGSWRLDLRTQALRCSDEVLRIYGVDNEERWSPGLLVRHAHPDDLPLIASQWDAALRTGRYDSEHRAVSAAGGVRWVRVRGEVEYDADGVPSAVAGSIQDVTERKEAELEIERHRRHLQDLVDERTAELVTARDAAEAANRTKTAFLANMSHEIRTPLNAILGLTHLIRQATTTPTQLGQLDRVGEAAQHLLALLDDILDLSKIEAGKLEVGQIGYEPLRVLNRAADLVRDRAAAKGLDLTVECAPDVPRRVGGDGLRVGQVLLNFASNAVKFTERGHVRLAVRRVEAPGEPPTLRFEVADTGIGLTPAQESRLFQPFEQGDASTTRRHGGTGLGLAICKRLVDLMNGRLGVDSRAGGGSTFWCALPLTDPPAFTDLTLPPAPPAPAVGDTGRVLVVEDNPTNREVAVELLRSIGVEVDTAADGAEAVARMATTAYGLVLMDLHMPRMDGLEATRLARRLPGGERVPIVALSADAFASSRQACLDAGMTDHLSKPIDPETLFAVVRRWLPGAPRGDAPRDADVDPDAWAALEAFPDLDATAGAARLGHRRAPYIDVLRRFVDHHVDDADALRTTRLAGDPTALRQRLHTLKGVTGTLGLHELHRRAAALEHAVRDEGGVTDERLAEFADVFAATLAGLRRALPAAVPSSEGDLERALPLARRLLRYLDQDDVRSSAALERDAPHLLALLGEATLAQLHREVDAFDLPAAARTLRSALNATPT